MPSETEKAFGGRVLPTMVLFESPGTMAFPGRARGDRVKLGSSIVVVDQTPRGSSPSTLCVPTTSTTSASLRPASKCCSERLCRLSQFLGIERFSFLPNRQGDGGDLAGQGQLRHLLADSSFFQTLNKALKRFSMPPPGRCPHAARRLSSCDSSSSAIAFISASWPASRINARVS